MSLAFLRDVFEPCRVIERNKLVASRWRFRAVVSDMDGLLLDTERIAHATFLEACKELGIPDQTQVYIRCIGLNKVRGRQVLHDGLAGLTDPVAFGDFWYRRYREETAEKDDIPLKPGAGELLRYLQQCGVPVAVATSSMTAQAFDKLGKAGVLDCVCSIVGGDQVENSKPHPEIYLKAAANLAVEPAECLALEDSENGVRSAVAAGMRVIQVPDFVEPSDELLRLGHSVFADLEEVLEWVRDLRETNPVA